MSSKNGFTKAISDGAVTERFIDAGGVRTCFLEAGTGRPVILVHGGGAGADSAGNWKSVIPLMADRHRVVAMDMIGFGKTAKPDIEYSQDRRICHLIDFIEAMKLGGSVSLVGNSMGGATALGVAVRRPDLVNSLVLMGSAGLNVKISEALLPIVNYDFTREGMVRLIKALANDKFKVDDAMVDSRYSMAINDETRKAYAATMGWIRQQGGLFYEPEFIKQVRMPTLVVNGKDDKVVPVETAYRFLELIENSWGYIIPHCGHWAMIEHPAEFAAVTVNFLAQRAAESQLDAISA